MMSWSQALSLGEYFTTLSHFLSNHYGLMVPVKECPDLLQLLWVLDNMNTDHFVNKDVLSSLKLTVENKIQMWKMANKMEEKIKMSTEV